MKRIGYLYEKICSKENIRLAIKNASEHKSKRRRPDIRRVLNNIDTYVEKIHKLLVNETYSLNNNIRKFQVKEFDKIRDIEAPQFYPDQIIHWCLIQVIKPILMKGMYRWNCGSIPGRGGKAVRQYINKTIKQPRTKYCLKLDIKKYFQNIDCKILYQKFERKIKDKQTLQLIHTIIGDGIGLPIGYYTSQWFSNFYLQDIDHFIKENLHIRKYVRYVDDMLCIDSNKHKLHTARCIIDMKLKTNANVMLKPNYQVFDTFKRHIDFVGFNFSHTERTKLRTRIFKKIIKRLGKIKRTRNCSYHQAMGMMSHIGWLKQIDAYQFYKESIKPVIKIGLLKAIISKYSKKEAILA